MPLPALWAGVQTNEHVDVHGIGQREEADAERPFRKSWVWVEGKRKEKAWSLPALQAEVSKPRKIVLVADGRRRCLFHTSVEPFGNTGDLATMSLVEGAGVA